MIIALKIDVKKIEKARLFNAQSGAIYLDITLLENKDGEDQYGNHFMAVQSVTKEERLAGKKGPILGNAKIISQGSAREQTQGRGRPSTRPTSTSNNPPPQDGDGPPLDDDVPF